MASITTRAGKGSPLTNAEVDANFTNLNNDKIEASALSPYLTSSTAASTYQPLDADLTAIAGLVGTTGLLRKTAANTWSLDTNSYLTGNQSITISGDASGSGTTAITLTLSTVPVSKGGTGATTLTGLVKGNGTSAFTAAVAGTDYVIPSALSTYAPLASPALTGTPTAPTAAVDTNTTQLATTAFVVGQGYLKSATAASTYVTLSGNNTFTGVNTFTPTARTSFATTPYFTLTTPADTFLSPGTEVIGANFTAATRSWGAGDIGTQRERVFGAPTYAAAGASTFGLAVNVDIAAPIAGTNVTIQQAFALRAAGIQVPGNLVFSGTGRRIQGDFSTATLADRTAIQTSTTNGATGVLILPNGTSTFASLYAVASATPTNASTIGITTATGATQLTSTRFGTGTYLPLQLLTSDTARVTIATDGLVGIGLTPAASQGVLQVFASGVTGGAPAATGTTDANQIAEIGAGSVQLSFGAYANGDAWIQQRSTANFATNYGLGINPNGGRVFVGGGFQETRVAVAASDIDLNSGNYFTRTISGATTLTVSNVPASGTTAAFVLELTNGGSATVNLWSGIKWAGGTAPTFTASGHDILGFYTHDGGTTWRGFLLAKDSK